MFHPIIADWFRRRFGSPTDVQVQSWPAIASGKNTLIMAPTGSGKTLAAFLYFIDALLKRAMAGTLEDRTHIVYVSPLKALSNDIQKNLQQPLAELISAASSAGSIIPDIRVAVRTGDTTAWSRQQMVRRPPHILITTPESLYLLLTARKSRETLREVRTVIIDEIHAVAQNKRGSHLALSIERLEALARIPPARIGLSATQRPIEDVARFLVGRRNPPAIIDTGHSRHMDLAVEVPKDALGAIATNAIWNEMYERLATLVNEHRSTLVFVNTRRLAERVGHHLSERLGQDAVATHHGSLSRSIRLAAEERLKNGLTRVVVATASLELGIDIGTVDLVCQIGSPRSIATCLQRVGRSGHTTGAMPKGRLFATTRDELIECAALVRAIRAGQLDAITIPRSPLDILAQQIVAEVAAQEYQEDQLYDLCTGASPYHGLRREDFDTVLRMLAEGISTRRSRGNAYLHHDRINHRIRARRSARFAAVTSGGAIPEVADYKVIAEPEGVTIGSVDEDFAVESLAGDILLLGNASWRIRGVEAGTMRVEDARGGAPTIPFWRGEASARTAELSAEVAAVRETIATLIRSSGAGSPSPSAQWLQRECGLGDRGATQAVAYVAAGLEALGAVPTQQTIIAERFFDEGGGMQLVIHSPFGYRINRAWGLALRKRFCVTFDFELQAAATDDGIVISLGEQHSFPLNSVFEFLHSTTVKEVLTQAMLRTPMFTTRWRWNVTRALAVLRFGNGRKVPPQIQRMRAEDLLAAIFPAAAACQENHPGPIALPDHPLVAETVRDCLTEAMDVEGLTNLLHDIEQGKIRCLAVESPAPSPLCHEILNSNPYSYLDDAPLEERRARAVNLRRSLPPDLAGKLGALDPAAIRSVVEEAWPAARDADEVHDALLTFVWTPAERATDWEPHLVSLVEDGRVVKLTLPAQDRPSGWVATERMALVHAAFPEADLQPSCATADRSTRVRSNGDALPDRADAVREIVRGWMECIGPTTAGELSAILHMPMQDVGGALLQLENQGQVLRGQFRGRGSHQEWCDRRLLSRIHRRTLNALRKEIEPVTAADFMRFLLRWQHVIPESRMHGEFGLLEVVRQLAGFEAAAVAWERDLLPKRVARYRPEMLDTLCLRGLVGWGRLSLHERVEEAIRPSRPHRIIPNSNAPLSLFPREDSDWLLNLYRNCAGDESSPAQTLSPVAQGVWRFLKDRGPSFFPDIVRGTGSLNAEVEDGLWELASAGLATADGFDNLRALLDPRRRAGRGRERARRPRQSLGRWSLLAAHHCDESSRPAGRIARRLLRRYGVVFRDLIARESFPLPWWTLLVEYRRLEAEGDIRGGRFVAGFSGEQFALPEAIDALRAARRAANAVPDHLTIAGTDPLNLVGIITPGPKIPALRMQSVVLRNGIPEPFVHPPHPPLSPLLRGRGQR